MSTAILTYLNGRGRGEVIRYMLSAANIEFTENFLTCSKDLNDLRETGKLLFRQIPLLEINGISITQTEAIIRYIARNYNLYGNNEEEYIKCDMIYDAIKDAGIGNSGLLMEFKSKEDKNQAKLEMKSKIKKYYPMFENILKNNPSGFFVSNNITFVDVIFLHDLEWLEDCLGNNILNEYPLIKKHQEILKNIPSISKYLNSEQKKKYPDATYLSVVKNVFYS